LQPNLHGYPDIWRGEHLNPEVLGWSSGISNDEFSATLLLSCYPFQGNPSAIGITSTAELGSRKWDASLAPGASQAGLCKLVHEPHITLFNHPADNYIGVFGNDVVKYLFVLFGCVLSCLDENRPKMFQMAAGFCPTSLRRAVCNSLLLFVCFDLLLLLI